jgi:hypothetical protein
MPVTRFDAERVHDDSRRKHGRSILRHFLDR